MNKINSEDNLEGLFGKMFNNPEEVGRKEGWNVPSEGVWDNIHAELQAEKKPRRLLLIQPSMAVAASFLLLVGCFQLYQYSQKIQQLSYQVAVNEQTVGTIQSNLEKLVYQKEGGLKNKVETIATIMNDGKEKMPSLFKVPSMKGTSNTIAETNKTELFKKTNKISIEKQQTKWNTWTVSKKENATDQENHLTNKEVDNLVANPVANLQEKEKYFLKEKLVVKPTLNSSISKLPTLFKSIKNDKEFIAPNINAITPSLKNKPSFYVAASYAPLSEESETNSNPYKEVGTFSSSEKLENSFTGALQFGAKLGKGWAVETGLRYTNSSTSMEHAGSIPYQLLEETLTTQGVYESTINLPLVASEAIETEVVFSRNAATLVEQEADLKLQIAFSKRLTSLDIPLLVKKQWAVGNLGLSIRAGLLNRFILQNNFDLPNVVIHDSRFQMQTTSIKEQSDQAKSTTYSTHLVAGVGIEYTICPRLSVYAEPTFTRSLQANANFDLANVYTEGKSVDLGVRYQL